MSHTFVLGTAIELSARATGGSPEKVVIESLRNQDQEIGVQLKLFSLGADGQYHLSLPTDGLNPGEYELTVAAVRGSTRKLLTKDSFVLSN